MINVTIIEDNSYMREGWETFINFEEDMSVVGSFESCEDALESEALALTKVVLQDISLPGMDGISGLKLVKSKFPDIVVIMATVYEDDEHVFEAIKAGAVGYLNKKVTPEELVAGIRDASEGGSPISPKIARKVIESFHRAQEDATLLTDKETEILNYLATGMSYSAIGKKIFLTVDGVRHHIRNIYKKLEVNSKSEAVAKGMKSRLIDPK